MDGFSKKVGQTTKDLAKQAAQRVIHERQEFLKSAKTNIGIEPLQQGGQGQSPSLVDEIITSGGVNEASEQDKIQIENQTRARMQRMEEELKALRGERAKESKEWTEAQNQILSPPKGETQETYLPSPSRHKRGMQGPGQKKKEVER